MKLRCPLSVRRIAIVDALLSQMSPVHTHTHTITFRDTLILNVCTYLDPPGVLSCLIGQSQYRMNFAHPACQLYTPPTYKSFIFLSEHNFLKSENYKYNQRVMSPPLLSIPISKMPIKTPFFLFTSVRTSYHEPLTSLFSD